MLHTASAALDDVERRLERSFEESARRAAAHSPHYVELWHALRSAADGGKRLRPRLLLAAYLELGGRHVDAAVELGAAIELLHTALLFHDDVIDGDVERRGAPNLVGVFAGDAATGGIAPATAQRWGQSAAILAGDLLLTTAVRMTAELDIDTERRRRIVELLDESIFRAAAGELADVAYAAGLSAPTVDDLRQMMADKTAHYSLELPLRAAAVLAGDDDGGLEDRLGAIGRAIGVLFQMRDDMLGVFGRPEETGKSASGDLREGKQTMLIAFARGSAEWAAAERHFGDPALDDLGAHRLRAALEACGARDRLEWEIRRQRDEVRKLIENAELPSGLVALLCRETDLAADRVA